MPKRNDFKIRIKFLVKIDFILSTYLINCFLILSNCNVSFFYRNIFVPNIPSNIYRLFNKKILYIYFFIS